MFKWEDIQQVVRIVAYGISGYLVSSGKLDPANGETLGGGLLALVSVVWWFFANKAAKATK